MQRIIALAGVALALVTTAASAAPKPMAGQHKMAATKYQCAKCHMQYSAADAKKDGYKCTMDGGKLVPMMSHSHMSTMHGSMMHGSTMK